MAGIYVHIPFCRRACHYCDFHFTTNLANSDSLVDAIVKEIELRKGYLNNELVKTVYFGGGTPSLLPTKDIERIFSKIQDTQTLAKSLEFTLEANPEDLSPSKLQEIKEIGVNRLSLGTQSFIDSELSWMNRMHSSKQAKMCIQDAQKVGFNNISIDLIFGLPNQSKSNWIDNLNAALALDIQHISSYSLTVEPKTVLHNRIAKGEQKPPSEINSALFFQMNMEKLPANGFEHYEISNYAKSGYVSKHNSSYWKGVSYLGLGPSAHSYNGVERQWNIKSNAAYIQNVNKGNSFSETELLSTTDRINDHILTGLRTIWGVQKSELDCIDDSAWNSVVKEAANCSDDELTVTDSGIFLTNKGKLKADSLTAQLFIS